MYLSQQVTRGPQRKASDVHHHVQRVGEPWDLCHTGSERGTLGNSVTLMAVHINEMRVMRELWQGFFLYGFFEIRTYSLPEQISVL